MAVFCEIMTGVIKVGWGVLVALSAFFFIGQVASAAPNKIVLQETDWRTGELEIKYTGAVPGNVLQLWTADHNDPEGYKLRDVWIATASEESHITSYIENGQTIWYYVIQRDPVTSQDSAQSNLLKQTPPVTVFVINWPDMLKDLGDALKASDDYMADKLAGLMTPSDGAMQDLQDALDGLKDALGAGQAEQAGNQIGGALEGGQSGMHPPAVVDDGNGTFTGGSTGGNLPNTPTSSGGSGGIGKPLEYPNPDSGTDGDMTIRIPYGVDMQGNLLYVKLFTQEQMEKMKWLGLLRNIGQAMVWILFAFWLVVRMTPTMKV